ncbi:MAG: efflux RND transporter periplasmic adaptor subunit [Cyclobacteriaceae bacterium]
MKRGLKRVLYVVVVMAIIFIIAYPKLDLSAKETAVSVSSARTVLTVEAEQINHETIDYSVRVTGTIIPDESVNLSSEVSAKIDQILFQEGEKVKKGQLLVAMNDDELIAELEKLKFTKKLNEDSEFRQRKLLEKEAISREEYEIALTTLNTSRSEIKLLETRRAKYKIYAPFTGRVGLREVSVGSYINPGSMIARVYSIDQVKIDFSVPGKYLKDINVGDQIQFTVDGYEAAFDGKIYAIEPQIDPQSRSIKLRAVSSNLENKLLPGQFAKINLILDRLDDSIMVPNIALIPELNQTKVFVYVDGKVETRIVEPGIRTEERVQIVQGLNPGDIIITSGLLQIRQGMTVNIQQ